MCSNNMEHLEAVIIDHGSTCKVGFAGDDAPKAVFPSIVGRPRHPEMLEGYIKIGHEAKSKRGILRLKCPIEFGIIKDFDEMEKIWHYAFHHELQIAPEEHAVILTDAPLNSSREKMTEVMFESFNVPATYIIPQSISTLFSTGRITGVVIDSGENATHIVPIFEGYTIPEGVTQFYLCGRDLTEYLVKIILENDSWNTFAPCSDRGTVNDIKEKLCYVALDFDKEMEVQEESYELPDGQVIKLGNERFRCPEGLFQPSLIEMESGGLHDVTLNAILKCDSDTRSDLQGNIILSGGTSLLPGLAERLKMEISKLEGTVSTKVIAESDRRYSSWLGASILASFTTFHKMWISKQEYDEFGLSIIDRKCFLR